MRLALTDEERAFADSVGRMLAKAGAASPEEQRAACRAMGLGGLGIPEDLGGAGGGAVEVGIVARLLQEAGWRDDLLETVARATPTLTRAGATDALRAIAAGKRMAAVCVDGRRAGEVSATRRAGRIVLSGALPLVRGGSVADDLLLGLRESGGAWLLLEVPLGGEGVEVRPVAVIDGALTVDIRLDGVVLPEDALARGTRAEEALRFGEAFYLTARLAGATAAIAALVRRTVEHVTTREQFGRALAGFQAVQHRVARMHVLADEARAAQHFAAAELGAASERRARALASAVVRITEIGHFVVREAVQLHGAMGFTAESPTTPHVRALLALRFGADVAAARARLAAFCRAPAQVARPLAGGAGAADPAAGPSLALTGAEDAFLEQARLFAGRALTEETRRGARLSIGVFADPDVAGPWHRALFGEGWIAPYLPVDAGGTGWSPVEAYLFEHAMAAAGAPALQLQGLRMLAPVLLRYGTPGQIARYLPRILSGEDVWCQGYSEPGAGSDLAALRTRAVRDGDVYVVNGSKIWTTQAQYASHMFALVRTSTPPRRQDGISFLLIDMHTPGITVRPIRTLSGSAEISAVFFDDVRVPRADLVGAENGGWECAKYLLDFERGGSTVSGPLRAYFARAMRLVASGAGDVADADIATVAAALDALEMLELDAIAAATPADSRHVMASTVKLRMAEIRQQIGDLAARALGREALRAPEVWPLSSLPPRPPADEEKMAAVPNHLDDFSYSIFAGSSEIQLSIIARALGLSGAR